MIDRFSGLRAGLLAAWCPTLGGAGFLLEDRSGSGYHMAIRAGSTITPGIGLASWVGGGNGRALQFAPADTDSALATARGVWPLYMDGSFTVSLWAAWTAAAQSNVFPGIFNHRGGASSGLEIATENTNTVFAQFFAASGGSPAVIAATSDNDGRWRNYTFVINRQTGVFTMYRLGVSVSTASVASVGGATPSATPELGRRSNAQTRWTGGVDDVRIYNRALSPSEVRLLASQRGIGLVPQRQRRTSASSKRLYLQVGGTWKETVPSVNVGGTWKEAAVYRHDGTSFKN
jgi:hypothetical protein